MSWTSLIPIIRVTGMTLRRILPAGKGIQMLRKKAGFQIKKVDAVIFPGT
jgi:hypothetical protein